MLLSLRSQFILTILFAFLQTHIGYQIATAQQVVTNETLKYHTNIISQPQQHHHHHQKCTKQSIILARQMLTYELSLMNDYLPLWLNDLDKDELIEEQKQALSSILMSGAGRKLLTSSGQPLFEIESSYFRPTVQLAQGQTNGVFVEKKFASELRSPLAANNSSANNGSSISSSARNLYFGPPKSTNISAKHVSLKLLRRYQDKCALNNEKQYYNYAFALSIGPFEHHLDVIYNLPHDLLISQPIGWRYAQVTIVVPKMNYEIILKQSIGSHNDHNEGGSNKEAIERKQSNINRESLLVMCPPIEIKEVAYVSQQADKLSISSEGLSLNNQTQLQIERLFDDYTKPTVTQRLRQMLRFYLSDKTLPLNV